MIEDRYLTTLEYPKIIAQLAEHTSFSAGREAALALRPSPEADTVAQYLRETTEAKALLASRPEISLGGAHDVRPLARRAQLAAMLQPVDFLAIRGTLVSARTLRNLLGRLENQYPLLADQALALDPLPTLIDEISRCLDDEGRVLDSASPELARIRRESSLARDRLVERLHRLVASGENARFLQEPIVTERNGRYVVPVRIEFKGRIPGIIHDQSSSGATLFVEPLETVELNNRWRQLQLAEQHEIERILIDLTRLVGQDSDSIATNVEVLARLDLALAKGRYSFALHAAPAEQRPCHWPVAENSAAIELSAQPLHLVRARHPLLPADTAVPIDAYLGGSFTALLVTGPNTGGKTVALKTVGLLACMNQAGLHIPAADGSALPVFDGIYADIGDEQSIEQSLSTFSSHLSHIVDILGRADDRSLVLLDELGAGTDPVEGAALAQALLLTLLERRALAMCSTHYSQLKIFAFNTPGVQNAAVEFDVETLSPTYRLVIGLPGRSNAFAIARRLGLEERIIERAEGMIAQKDVQADALLTKVRTAGEAAERARIEGEERLQEIRAVERDLRAKLGSIEEARRQVLEQARSEARREVERVQAELRRVRASLLVQPAAAQASPPREVLQETTTALSRLASELTPLEPVAETAPGAQASVAPQELRVGDVVLISTLGQTGELLAVNGLEAEVKIGGFRLRTRLGALEFRERPGSWDSDQASVVGRPQGISPGIELDMRGWRAEEVAPQLDRYLDNAYLAALPWVHIIHGKGMGILKEVVRQQLAGHPLVASYRAGGQGEGGEGVTVVVLHKSTD